LRNRLLGHERDDKGLIRFADSTQGLEQSGPAIRSQGVDDQIALFVAKDAGAIGVEPKLSRNTNGLTVAVVKDPSRQNSHSETLSVYDSVCILKKAREGRKSQKADRDAGQRTRPDQRGQQAATLQAAQLLYGRATTEHLNAY